VAAGRSTRLPPDSTAASSAPLDAVNFSGLSGTLTAHDQPQFQAKLTYTSPDKYPAKVKLWTNVVTQRLVSNSINQALPVDTGTQETGLDYGGKLTVGAANLVAYGYKGWGLGTTGLFFDAVTPTGLKRGSYGYYFQGTYTFVQKFTVGASYGLSHLGLASGEINPALVNNNNSEIDGIRYKLTPWMNLVSEYTHTRAVAYGGNGRYLRFDRRGKYFVLLARFHMPSRNHWAASANL
jgi:hypothetical protein